MNVVCTCRGAYVPVQIVPVSSLGLVCWSRISVTHLRSAFEGLIESNCSLAFYSDVGGGSKLIETRVIAPNCNQADDRLRAQFLWRSSCGICSEDLNWRNLGLLPNFRCRRRPANKELCATNHLGEHVVKWSKPGEQRPPFTRFWPTYLSLWAWSMMNVVYVECLLVCKFCWQA